MPEPNCALANVRPLDLARTETGARLVERLLGHIHTASPYDPARRETAGPAWRLRAQAVVEVWRITAPEYADTALSGEGARLWGGRCGSTGRRVVYASGSLALATLEVIAGANDRRRLRGYLAVGATFDEQHLEVVEAASLPAGRDARPYTAASQTAGDAWLDEERSLALRVPSVVVPSEWNVLLNPVHLDFEDVLVGPPTVAPFDPRLVE